MENTPNIRIQTLLWLNMESQIHWTDETEYAWFTKPHIAKIKKHYTPSVGYFSVVKGRADITFHTKDGGMYFIHDIAEFAEL